MKTRYSHCTLEELKEKLTNSEFDDSIFDELHYRLWDWVANNPTKHKLDWPGWSETNTFGYGISLGCFMCEKYQNDCSYCPLGEEEKREHCRVYFLWRRAVDRRHYYSAARFARFIRDINNCNYEQEK